jgi:hypothetical protein
MTFCRPILILVLTVLVAGCASSPEQLAKRDGDRCSSRGYQPGSKQHDDCISRLEGGRDARMQQRHRELVEGRAPSYGR